MHQTIENTQPTFSSQQYNGAFQPSVVPYKLSYSFDYERFENCDLSKKAKSTLGSFFGFVRASFDGLLEIGRMLQELYFDCIASSRAGKKVFGQWLTSRDFGASSYIAKSAMKISAWFDNLPARIQQLLQKSVQSWSVSALRLLTRVADDVIEEVINSGAKTAAQIKQLQKRNAKNTVKKSNGTSKYQDKDSNGTESISEQAGSIASNCAVELAPGIRIVVTSNDVWNGYAGIIMSIHAEGEFWVLLDHTVSQGMEVKHLLKCDQLQPEIKRVVTAHTNKIYSQTELEAKISEALVKSEREAAELEQARFIEIRDAALETAKKEIIAAQQHARHMKHQKEQLAAQLEQAKEEIYRLRALQVKNQQLEQRVADLEKAVEGANMNSWKNTFNKQAVKVLNSEVEKAVLLLMSEVERLQALVSMQEEEILKWRQSEESNAEMAEVEKIIKEFGKIAESLGWNGWNRHGYRAADGTLHKDISAISNFIYDLKEMQEAAFQN